MKVTQLLIVNLYIHFTQLHNYQAKYRIIFVSCATNQTCDSLVSIKRHKISSTCKTSSSSPLKTPAPLHQESAPFATLNFAFSRAPANDHYACP